MGKSAWNAANSTNKQIDSTQTRGLFATRTARTTHTLRTPRALMYALIAALLALTAVLALPRVVYASIVGPTAWADNLTWEITDAGELIIKPADATKRAAIGSSAYSPQGSAEQASKEKWPWHAYREQITKVTMSAHTAAGKPAIETYGDGRLAYMFADMPNLTEADVSGLLTTRVQDVRGMFKNCSSLTELDLSEWINNGSMQYMQDLCNGCSSLTKFTLNNKDFHTKVIKAATHAADYKTYTLYEGMNGGTKTYNVGIQEDETKGSCQSQRMFDGCDALEEIDMQNITISTWKKPEEGDANQNTFIRSIRNLPNIKKINMNGIKLPGLKAGVLGGEFVFHKDTLEEFYFGNVDVDDSLNDSTHDAIYETALEEVVDKLIEGCSALQIIDLSGWDTSAIGEKEPDAEGNYIVFGFKELMEDYGAPLQKLIAEDAKIWMHTKDPVSVNGTIAPYDISDGLQANENDESGDALANLHIDWHFNFTTDADDSGETVYNLESNPDDAHTLHGVIGTENGYGNLASGTYIVGSPTEPRDPWKDDEGITTIPQTYYTVKSLSNAKLYISEDGGASYTEVDPTDNSWNWQKEPGGDTAKYIERGDYHIQNSNGWRIFSRNMSVNEWDTKTQGNEAKLNDNVKLRFVYEQAAVDVNGKLHDVAVDINNVTFKDMDKIPILGEDYKVDPYGVNPWIPGTSYDAGTFSNGTPYDAGTFNRTDQDRLVGSAPDGTGGYLYDKNQTYTRQLITAQGNTLEFWNQIRKSTNLVSSSTGYALDKELLSKGSGTYIDYNITVDGALPDTSVLFWMGDLDVAHSQEWEMHESNMNQDRMISDAYGPGSEGIVLGSGNDLDTLTTARNTGLDRYTYDSSDYNNSQSDANGNYIVGSGTDPNTSWSRFYLRADAQGANYIWTSGISCKTEILGAANVTVDSLPPVYVIPEARKTVNYALPTGEYKDAFSFTIAKADEISDIEYEYTWWDGVGQDATSTQERVTLPNSVDDDFSETRSNDGGVVPFSTLTFTAPGSTDPEDAWSEGFDPHKYNEHRAKAYIYRITEEIPDNADDSVLKYNREKVVYYLKVVVTNPKTDLEMHKGTRADVTMGEYHYYGDDPYYASSHDDINWGETRTIWSQDALYDNVGTLVGNLGDDNYPFTTRIAKTTPDGYPIYKYGGIEYYLMNGNYYNVSTGVQATGTLLNNLRRYGSRVYDEYSSLSGSPVYVSKNGVTYYEYDGQYYRYTDQDNFLKEYVPVGPQTVDGRWIFTDASGKKFYRDGGSFKSYPSGEEVKVAKYEQEDMTAQFDSDGDGVDETYTVYADKDGVRYIKVPDGSNGYQYLDPSGNWLGEALEDTVFPADDDQIVPQEKKVDGTDLVVRMDVHGIPYVKDGNAYYQVILSETGATKGAEIDVEDSEFNPDDATDRIVYENKTVEYGGKRYPVKQDRFGTKYIEVPGAGGAGPTYYAVDDNNIVDDSAPLTEGTDVDVSPSSTDKPVTQNKKDGHALIINGHTIYEDSTGVRYYEDNGTYYSVLGTVLTNVNPNPGDQPVTSNYNIRQDEDGNLFYKGEGEYTTSGTYTSKYYNVTEDGQGGYVIGSEYAMPANLLDTSEAAVVGSFDNHVKSSEIVIEKETVDGKAGEFTLEIEFDNDFEPTQDSFVFDPVTPLTEDDGTGTQQPTQFTKVADGKYRFKLADGQKVTIKNVPFQTVYTVREIVEANGWELVSVGGDEDATSVSGKVTVARYTDDDKKVQNPDWNYDHTFTNRFTELVVRKKVEGIDISEDKEFFFGAKATISGLKPEEEFSYGYMQEDNDQKFKTATANENGEAEIALDDFVLKGKEPNEDIVLVLPKGAKLVVTETPDPDFKTTWSFDGSEPAEVNDRGETGEVEMKEDKKVLIITNIYQAHGNWYPTAYKILDGRPLERDQFEFELKAGTAEDDDTVQSPMQAYEDKDANQLGSPLFYKYDPATNKDDVKATLQDGGDVMRPVRTDGGVLNTGLFADKIDTQRSRGLFTQEVEAKSDADGVTYKDMGTGDVYGPVLFGPITYTIDDLKDLPYSTAPDIVKNSDKITWTDGNTAYVKTIPDSAVLSEDVTVGETTYPKGTSYASAAGELKEAVDASSAATSKWVKGDTTYTTSTTIPDVATAKYRVFTYKMYEKQHNSGTDNTDYGVTTYDTHSDEGNAYEIKVVVAQSDTGPLTVTPMLGDKEITPITGSDPVLFENTYLAKGDVQLKATKKIDGRDAFGRETFTGNQEFEFEVTAITENTPLPEFATKAIKPGATGDTSLLQGSNTTAEINFGDIEFTSFHFTDGKTDDGVGNATTPKFIATRNADGLYERTFIYKITETSPAATDGNGLSVGVDPNDTKDTRASILVAVTVTEDKYGNLTVTRVNSADADQLDVDVYKNQYITLMVDEEGKETLPKTDDDYEAHSTVGAGTIYNTYQASGTEKLEATKVLENATLKDNMFYFELVQLDKSGAEVRSLGAAPNKADGSITFDEVVYNLSQVRKDAEGDSPICDGPDTESEDATKNEWIYKYLIRELVPDAAAQNEDITYDTTTYYAKVTVSDVDGDGTLDTSVKYYSDAACSTEIQPADVKFTNTGKVEAVIAATKDVEGADWDESMNFWFNLKAVDGTDAEGNTIAAADVPVPSVTRRVADTNRPTVTWDVTGLEPGATYNYTVEEIEGMGSADPNEWELDSKSNSMIHEVKVEVDAYGNVTISYDGQPVNSTYPEPLTITNKKQGSNLNIHAIKKVTDDQGNGDYWRNGDTYTLVLEAAGKLNGPNIDSSAMASQPMPDGSTGTTKKVTVTSSAASNANFGVIKLDDSVQEIADLQVGESIDYLYYLYEEIPDDATNADNVRYADATDAQKTTGGFKLNGVTYDSAKHRAVVTVARTSSGLTSSVYYYDATGGHPEPAVINNTFTADADVDLQAKKVVDGANIDAFTTTITGSDDPVSPFTFTLYESDGTTIATDKDGNEIKNIRPSLTDGTTSAFTFAYDEADIVSILNGSADSVVKTYILKEDVPADDADKIPGITYDATEHTITVTLTLEDDGTLEATTTAGDGTAAADQTAGIYATVTNTYDPTADQTFTVKKHLDDRPITRNGFTFTLAGLGTVGSINESNYAGTINGIDDAVTVPMPDHTTTRVEASTTNFRSEDTADFESIEYTMDNSLKKADGTYETSRIFVYKITEEEGTNTSIAYDTEAKTIYYAFVTLTNNISTGTLEKTVTYVKHDVAADTYTKLDDTDELLFTNVYDAQGTATVTAIKQIIGREWTSSDEFTFTVKPYETESVYSYTGGSRTDDTKVEASAVPVPGNDISTDRTETGGTSAEGTATINGNDVGNGEHFATYSASNPDGFKPITYTDDMLTWDSADGILKGHFFYEITENTPVPDGFEQTGTQTFYARVDVTDNRVGGLQTHVYYFTDVASLDTVPHENPTPVFQNTYSVDTSFNLPVTKQIDGRDWTDTDAFDFTLTALNTAPVPTSTALKIEITDNKGMGAEVDSMDDTKRTDSYQIPVTLANLISTTTSAVQGNDTNAIRYTNGDKVPVGVKYGVFRYRIDEAKAGETHADITYQADPVYVEVQVVDDLQGGVDTKVTYYSDSEFTTKIDTNPADGAFVNVYDTYAQNPAEILVRKDVKESDGTTDHTWAASDSYSFTIEALNGAPTTRQFSTTHDALAVAPEQTTLEIENSSKAKWITTNDQGQAVPGEDVTHAAAVSIPIRMSNLDTDAQGNPKDTVFLYKVTEQAGSLHGVTYNTNPVYVQVTAKPQADGTLKLEYAYFTDAACTSAYHNTDADGQGNGFTVTNKFGVSELKVEKTWLDGKDVDDNTGRPDITIHLTQSIDGGAATTLRALPHGAHGAQATLTAADGTTHITYGAGGATVSPDQLPVTFANLPAFTADGKAITYSVIEDEPDGYRLSNTDDTTTPGTITFTNTLLTEVPVTKVWNDGNTAEAVAARPEAVVAGLLVGNSSFPTRFAAIEANNDWATAFTNLDAYDEKNQAIAYDVVELGVPTDYSSVKTGDAQTGYTITNTKLEAIEVNKVWIGGATSDVEFKLYRTSDEVPSTIENDAWTPGNTWEEVPGATHTFATSQFEYKTAAEGGDVQQWVFEDLPAYDAEGRAYTYRVKETTQSNFFTSKQLSDLTVENTNGYTAIGTAKPNVVKELDGRDWLDSDTFYFKIESVNVTDEDGQPVQVDGVNIPLPMNGTQAADITSTDVEKAQVGAIGRSVDFDTITFTNVEMANADGSTADVRNFNYKIYEVTADGTPVTDSNGITYDTSEHTLRIEVTDNGDGTLSTNRYWDGAETSSAVPVFTNTYSSKGDAKLYIEKQIETRAWNDTDSFTFTITGISGTEMHIGNQGQQSFTTRAMTLSDVADENTDSIQLSDTLVAMGTVGNTFTGDMLVDGKASFIYQIQEDAGSVDDLAYDQSTIYLKLDVSDNWDGTLSFKATYYEDAACTTEIADHTVLLDAAGNLTTETEGNTTVNVAHFTNTLKVDVPVKKIWADGPAVEDVTVHLQRALFPLDVEDQLTAEYVEANVEANDGWHLVGLSHSFQRGEFAEATEATYIFEDLPMYVSENGTTYRAVYKLVEDDTSDAYTASYTDQIFISDQQPTVTNTVTATNEANIAAVKQLLGREWLAGDDFAFTLEPIGKGTYDADGNFTGIEQTTDIPMPAADAQRLSTTADGKATTHATPNTSIVDTEGKLERLARFGAIEYTVNDLVYDPTDRHHQGDFFYKMTEVVKTGNDAQGITYSTKESIVHVKVRENRTNNLTVQVAYDETTQGNVATGTQFTPVFTNTYDATAVAAATLDKYIMGRDWAEGDEFDFTMNPLAGAPFEDADASEFPEVDTHTDEDREVALAAGKAVHNNEGSHVKRLVVPATAFGTRDKVELTFPAIEFRLAELNKLTGENEFTYTDGTPVPVGMAYSQFMYAIEETVSKPADLMLDSDTEYVRYTVIDKGDGTLDISSEIFEDRYGTIERVKPNTTEPAEHVVFVNQLARDVIATKNWADPATSDVEFKLQWTTDDPTIETNWHDAEGTVWIVGVDTTHTIHKDAEGEELTVSFSGLPAYAPDTDDLDLNDKWVYYRVVETTTGDFEVRYSDDTAFEPGTTAADYSATPLYTEVEDADTIVSSFHVINFPNDFDGAARVFVVKQLVGKDWTNESFDFTIEPVESKLGGETEAVSADQRALPMPENASATASASTAPVGKNEHNAEFAPIAIKLSDLVVDQADGIAKGSFTYKVTEDVPAETGDIIYTTDEHFVTVTATNNGNGEIATAVTWDGRPVGDFVPVYVNSYKEITRLKVSKVWVGDTEADRPESLTIQLQSKTASDGAWSDVDGKTLELTAENDWTNAFEDLPAVDVDGNTVSYRATEVQVPEGYTAMTPVTFACATVITNVKDPDPIPQITVTHDADNGTEATVDTIERGANEPAQPADPTREGYSFGGWDRTQDENGNVIYKARWIAIPEPGQISVTYTDGQGHTIVSETIERGTDEPEQPADPTRDGFEFVGWDRTTDENGNVVYEAQWKEIPAPEQISVTHNPDNGESATTTTITKGDSEPAQPADPTKDGYTFGGWDRTEDENGNVIYKARWIENPTPEQIVVSYKDGDLTIVTDTIERGTDEPAQPANPSKDGFRFTGWQRTVDENGNVTYDATWEEIPQVTITHDPSNGADPTVDTIRQGDNEPAQPADPTREGYIFGGWDRTQDEQGNVIYRARWIPVDPDQTIVVTYKVDNQDVEGWPQTILRTADEPGAPADPTKEGFEFIGWKRSTDPATGNVTYEAQWKEIEPLPEEEVVVARKVWNDANNQDGIRPERVDVEILANGQSTDVTLTLSDQNNWVAGALGLPKFDEGGQPIAYTVSEQEVAGYTCTIEGDTSVGFTITNTHIPETTSVTATKLWTGEPEGIGQSLRQDVELHLFGTNLDGEIIYDGGSKTIPLGQSETSWENQPVYANGKRIIWVITEDAIAGYSSQIDYMPVEPAADAEAPADNTARFTVTNSFVEPLSTITATKQWQDDNNRDGKRPDAVTFELWKKVGTEEPAKVNEKVVNEAQKWQATWTNLPVTEMVGNGDTAAEQPVLYTVREKALAAESGYQSCIQSTEPGTFTVMNYRSIDTTDITIKKAWADGDDADGMRPDHIAVRLLSDGTPLSTHVISAETEWTATITGLPVNAVGMQKTAITYTIEELGVDGYTPIVTGDQTAGYLITNTRELSEPITLRATKIWAGDTGLEATRPDVSFHLMKVVEGTGPIEVPEQTKTIAGSATGEELSVVWSDLPSMEAGKHVTYTVTEDAVAGYTSTISNGSVEGNVISIDVTNTRIPTPEPERITITYEDGQGNVYEGWPQTIERGTNEPAQAADPTREGYTFGGWNRETDPATGNVVYKARWTPVPEVETITISYIDLSKPEDEQLIQSDVITRGDNEPAAPADPTQPGYTFTGWMRMTDPETGNVTYVATWAELDGVEPRVIYVDPKAGEGNTVIGATKYDGQAAADEAARNHTNKPADPEHEGLVFVGWVMGQDEFGDYVFVANYNEPVVPVTKTVTYVDPQGTELVVKSVEADDPSSVEPPADPEHEGMVFVGWESGVDVNGNTVYAAKYRCAEEPETYWVVYEDPATGRIIREKTTVPVGEQEPPAPEDPEREGFKFDGWNRSVDEEGNVTYTARWKPLTPVTDTPPTKTADSTAAVATNHVHTYTITQLVSSDATALDISDTLDKVLGFVSTPATVKVTCEGIALESDVTIQGQVLRVHIGDAEAQGLRGKTVLVSFQAVVRAGADLSGYTTDDKNVAQIANTATTVMNENPEERSYDSNTANVLVALDREEPVEPEPPVTPPAPTPTPATPGQTTPAQTTPTQTTPVVTTTTAPVAQGVATTVARTGTAKTGDATNYALMGGLAVGGILIILAVIRLRKGGGNG